MNSVIGPGMAAKITPSFLKPHPQITQMTADEDA
jgi:hypothetical protein